MVTLFTHPSIVIRGPDLFEDALAWLQSHT